VTDSINDILNGVTLTSGDVTTPSYTISASPWVGSATGSTSNLTWSNPNVWTSPGSFTINPNTTGSGGNISAGTLSLNGDNADIQINGVSLVDMLKRIEERINILTVNTKLESEWEELRELGDQYRALEQHIKDKMETWAKLNAQDKDNR
jgi:hypothetical protein